MKIYCLVCGDIFEGDGNVVFCTPCCKDEYDEIMCGCDEGEI